MKKLLILLGLVLFVNGYIFAAVPNEIRYNGKIKEYRQEVNGTRNINFRIYDALTAGSQKWQSGTNSVQISSGVFSVILAPDIDWRNKDYYIELEVNSKVLSPREKLTSVPYSLHSATSEGGSVEATGEYSVTVGSDKKLIVNSEGVKEVKGSIEYYMVPKGGIIIWSGAANAIPDGWVLCDGNNGTPDLRGRFVLGYGTVTDDNEQTKTYNVGDSAGEINHTLTIAEMPSHNHTISIQNYSENGQYVVNENRVGSPGVSYESSVTWTANYSGGGSVHNNMPPYYTLCYIMKN